MIDAHLTALEEALRRFQAQTPRLESWGRRLAAVLEDGGRLLACGNGGSAEQAQHLTAELVGRYQTERRPFAAIPLHTDISALTAIGNDYGHEEMFARQVRAHGRPGDVLVCLSTSGSSRNIIAAAKAAAEVGVRAWALTGPGPNPLAGVCAEAITVEAPSTATVQEVHLAAIHMLCAAVDAVVCGPSDGAVMCGTGDGAVVRAGTGDATARGTDDGTMMRGATDGAMARDTGDGAMVRGAADGGRRVMDLDREAEEAV